MTETPINPQSALWNNIENKTLPYSIMFMVEDNCPVYMDDYRDWTEYFIEAWPLNTYTYFVTEEKQSLNINLAALKFCSIFEYCKEIVEDGIVWTEHNGVIIA
jgi:hypothetical protein